jgi:hypothetical protein
MITKEFFLAKDFNRIGYKILRDHKIHWVHSDDRGSEPAQLVRNALPRASLKSTEARSLSPVTFAS